MLLYNIYNTNDDASFSKRSDLSVPLPLLKMQCLLYNIYNTNDDASFSKRSDLSACINKKNKNEMMKNK